MSQSVHHSHYSTTLPNNSSSSLFTRQCHVLLHYNITNSLSCSVPLINFTFLFHLCSHRHDQAILATTTSTTTDFLRFSTFWCPIIHVLVPLLFCLQHNYCHGSNSVKLSFDLSKYHPKSNSLQLFLIILHSHLVISLPSPECTTTRHPLNQFSDYPITTISLIIFSSKRYRLKQRSNIHVAM